MNDAECRIAVKLGIHNYTYRVKVIYLIKRFRLIIHFLVNAVNRLDPSRQREFDTVFGKTLRDRFLGFFKEHAVDADALFDVLAYLLISDRVKIFESQHFKLLLDTLHTETVRKRCIHMHGLKRDGALFFRRAVVQSAHIMQPVGKFYEYDAQILAHGKKHFAQVFDRLILLCDKRNFQLCDTVDDLCDITAEFLFYHLKICLVRTIFDRVMQKRGADRICIELKLGAYFRHRDRMNYIRFARNTELSFMTALCQIVCAVYFFKVIASQLFKPFVQLFILYRHEVRPPFQCFP